MRRGTPKPAGPSRASHFGHATRRAPSGSAGHGGRLRTRREGEALVGWGMAPATYPAKRQPASAVARLTADGTIAVQAATHEFGTGTYTAMSQVAAEALGVPLARIRFELGDTDYPENPISA